MQKETITGVLPRLKPRFGVIPGRIEHDRPQQRPLLAKAVRARNMVKNRWM